MFRQLLQALNSTRHMLLQLWKRGCMSRRTLFLLIALFVASFVQIVSYQQEAFAAEVKADYACTRYIIRSGDTLSAISAKAHINIPTLARANNIFNINLIFAHRSLCLPQTTIGFIRHQHGRHVSGMLSSGSVHWYAYNALEQSNYSQVQALLRRAAAFYGSPHILFLPLPGKKATFSSMSSREMVVLESCKSCHILLPGSIP